MFSSSVQHTVLVPVSIAVGLVGQLLSIAVLLGRRLGVLIVFFGSLNAFEEGNDGVDGLCVVQGIDSLTIHLTNPRFGNRIENNLQEFVGLKSLIGVERRNTRNLRGVHLVEQLVEVANLHVRWLATELWQSYWYATSGVSS